LLIQNGVYLDAADAHTVFFKVWTSTFGSQKAIFSATGLLQADELAGDLILLKELAVSGMIQVVIDCCYPLEQTAEANRFV